MILLGLTVGVAVAYVTAVAGILVLLRQPPARMARISARLPILFYRVVPFKTLLSITRGGALNIGDAAPDFDLETVDRLSRVRLSSFRGQKPVVLIFGSYT